jgi:hypothetical protein
LGIANTLIAILNLVNFDEGDPKLLLRNIWLATFSFAFGIGVPSSGAALLLCGPLPGEMIRMQGRPKRIFIVKLWRSFGDRWWQRLITLQKGTTDRAWAGVNWDDDAFRL